MKRAVTSALGAEFLTDEVTEVDFSERPFRISVGNNEHRAKAVIVATGASARYLGLESEQRLLGRDPRTLALRGEPVDVHFDAPRDPVWEFGQEPSS